MYFAMAQEMERLDALAAEAGLTVQQMMELAGWHMLEVFRELAIDSSKRICILVGVGHKAGDGLSAARHLVNAGYSVQVILMDREMKSASKKHLALVEGMNIPVWLWREDGARCAQILDGSDVVIDALIGYRLEGTPRDSFREVIEGMNLLNATVISYDIPTGINPSSGLATAVHMRADATLTLGLPKKGLDLEEGRKHAGRVFVADLGIPAHLYDQIHVKSRPPFKGKLIEI